MVVPTDDDFDRVSVDGKINYIADKGKTADKYKHWGFHISNYKGPGGVGDGAVVGAVTWLGGQKLGSWAFGRLSGWFAKSAANSGTTIYRAVSQAELEDIAAFGMRNKAGAYETGKLFAPTLEEAAQFGRNNYLFDGLPNTIMKVRVPNSVMQNAYRFGADGMNAISIPSEYLQFLKATPLNFSPLP